MQQRLQQAEAQRNALEARNRALESVVFAEPKPAAAALTTVTPAVGEVRIVMIVRCRVTLDMKAACAFADSAVSG